MCISCLWARLGRTQGDIICIASAIRRLYATLGVHFSLSGHCLPLFLWKVLPKLCQVDPINKIITSKPRSLEASKPRGASAGIAKRNQLSQQRNPNRRGIWNWRRESVVYHVSAKCKCEVRIHNYRNTQLHQYAKTQTQIQLLFLWLSKTVLESHPIGSVPLVRFHWFGSIGSVPLVRFHWFGPGIVD